MAEGIKLPDSLIKTLGADLPPLPYSDTGSIADLQAKKADAERKALEYFEKGSRSNDQQALLTKRKREETQPIQDMMATRMQSERLRKDEPLAQIPELQQTQISPEQTKEAFTTFLTFAMLGGALTRQPMLAAMNSMTAAMKGWQEGDTARTKAELESFDRNFKIAQAKRSGQIEERKAAHEKYKGDIEALQLEEKQIALKYQDEIAAELARKGDMIGLGKHYDVLAKNYETSIDHAQRVEYQARQLAEKEKADQMRHDDAVARQKEQEKRDQNRHDEMMAQLKEKQREFDKKESDKGKGGKAGATVDDVKKFLGVDFGSGKQADTKNDQAAGIANATAEALSLQNYVHKHPDVVGRVGQVKSFIDRYVKSLDSTGSETGSSPTPESAQEQEALLFAKRYAAYLIRYEQALAGSAKGFTVQFMKRFNELMQSNQFSPEGFDKLMAEQMREYKSSAGKLSTKITLDQLQQYGIAQTQDPDAIEGYARFKQQSGREAPAAPGKVFHTPKSSASGIEPPKSTLDKTDLKKKAQARIAAGANETEVKQRYKDLTGEDF